MSRIAGPTWGVVGSLAYLAIDRSDTQFETNSCAKQMKQPTLHSLKRLKRLARYLVGTQSARVVLRRPGPDYEQNVAFLRIWSDSDWGGDHRDRKSQSSVKVEVDGCPLFSASRKQKARAHSSGEAEFYAAAGATSEGMLIREVLLHSGLEVKTELLLDSAAARGICRREGVGSIRHLSTKVLWLQQLTKRGVISVGATSSTENHADLGTKSLPVTRFRLLRGWNGIHIDEGDGGENGEGADDDDEESETQHAAQVSSGEGSVLQALANLLLAVGGCR